MEQTIAGGDEVPLKEHHRKRTELSAFIGAFRVQHTSFSPHNASPFRYNPNSPFLRSIRSLRSVSLRPRREWTAYSCWVTSRRLPRDNIGAILLLGVASTSKTQIDLL